MIYDSKTAKSKHVNTYIYTQFFELVNANDFTDCLSKSVDYCFNNVFPYQLHWINDLSECWGTQSDCWMWLNNGVNNRMRLFPHKGICKVAFVRPRKDFKQLDDNIDFYVSYSRIQLKDEPVVLGIFNCYEQAQSWVCPLDSPKKQ